MDSVAMNRKTKFFKTSSTPHGMLARMAVLDSAQRETQTLDILGWYPTK